VERLQGYGEYGELSIKWFMIGYRHRSIFLLTDKQGYEVSQQELNISIESFLANHCKAENPNEIEYVN